MNVRQTIFDALGRLLGLEQMQSLAGCKFGFAASWAQRAPLWLFFGFMALCGLASLFYFRYQPARNRRWRIVLFVLRAIVLCQVLLLLAEPILMLTISSRKRPALWVLFDGTESMGIADDLPPAERDATSKAVGMDEAASPGASAERPHVSRMDYLKAMVQKKDQNLLEQLGKSYRVQAFLFDSPQSVRSIDLAQPDGRVDDSRRIDRRRVVEQLTTNGKVTALGAALNDLARRHTTANLGGLVIFSDFNQNAGPPAMEAARQLGTEIYTVGVGATQAVDVAAEVSAEPYARKDDRAVVTVMLKQTGLDGQMAHVRLYAEPLGSVTSGTSGRVPIGEQTVELTKTALAVPFSYVPARAGRLNLVAEVDPLPGEVIDENNRAQREIVVLEDYLRLLFVEYEPTWEWRFIKEVFHRSDLVGMKGFRTFLYSSDPQVRGQNELFLTTMAPPRNEFFANDLIFLGDMPAAPPTSALSGRFCNMVKEFVGDMGGGLVILSGPRFGPQQLAGTPLADLLPVKVDPQAPIRDQQPFTLKLTPRAAEYKFMQLGTSVSPKDMQRDWDSLGLLPWYQPALRVHPQATVLAEHPTATCVDGEQKQPLIAIRPYGRGEVVYLAFDETFRLRRGNGERLFRQFWGQLMERLAMNHALGAEKRFVVRTDRRQYRLDETVTVTVEARTADYQPLSESDLGQKKLRGELLLPAEGTGALPPSQSIGLTQVKNGQFETRFTATAAGEHRIRVVDPVSNKPVEWTFRVINTPVERQRPVRNVVLQESLAAETGGRSYDLKDVQSLVEGIRTTARTETSTEVVSLVNTWLCFAGIVGLLLTEWLLRKWISLP